MNKRLLRLLAAGTAATLITAGAPVFTASNASPLPGVMSAFSQASLGDAQALLQEALARLERAKNEGGDVAAAQAEVDAAQAAVEALKQAEAQKAADEEAAAKAAAEGAAKAEADAAAKAEADAAAKAVADEEAAKQAEAQKAAEAEAAAKAEADAAAKAEADAAAKAAADEEAAKQAEAQKAAEAAAKAEADAAVKAEADAAAKAAAEAEAAAKAAADEAAKTQAEPVPAAPADSAAPAVEPVPAAPADSVAPVDPAAPAVEPVPAAPADSVAPVDPAAPAVEPVPAAPADSVAPVDPAAPAVEPAPAAPADQAAPAPADPASPADPAAPVTEPAPVAPDPVTEKLPDPLPENAAPVFDSAKELVAPAVEGQQAAPAVVEPTTPPPPPPVDDKAAQIDILPLVIESAVKEEGVRLTALPVPEAPRDQEVVKVIDNRTIINVNNVYIIESPDAPRLAQKDDEVFVERLPRGRTRETIVRENGVQVVTIRNRYGDIIQRSRILPDGREVILAYTPDYDTEEEIVWRDPGLDLPPLRLNVPIRDYILSVSLIEDQPEEYDEEVVYYDFLEKPPVERVERTYSVNEVKRSARVRDKVRRIDLDTITFGFGSADIKEDQIEKLDSVASAMLKLLEKNPAETFLIEGHTDAVGTDIANLNLSDKRAESIANALSNSFGVPPENLTTQGYGERYLKVNTTKPEELNRRVAIRRITSLVAPVASK